MEGIMERIYKSILVLAILVAIGWGVWYCVSAYHGEPIIKDGTLVWEMRGNSDAGNYLY